MATPAASFDAPPAPAKPAAVWEDLIDIFTSPAAVFARRRDGRFWLALVVYTVLGAAAFAAARPAMQPLFDRQIAAAVARVDDNAQMSGEQREANKRQVRAFVESPLAMAGGLLAIPVGVLATAATLWLVGKTFGSGATYGQTIAVTSIAGIPRAVVGLLNGGAAALLGRQIEFVHQLTVGPGAVLGDVGAVASALLARFDLGVLWHTALLGVGLALMGRVTRRGGGPAVEGQLSRGTGLAAAGVVWALATLLNVFQAYAQPA